MTYDLEINMVTEVYEKLYIGIYKLEMESCIIKVFDLKGNMIQYIKPKYL